MATEIFITGASSGIGEAMTRRVPFRDATTTGIARRRCALAQTLSADLAEPSGWAFVAQRIDRILDQSRAERAIFIHMAGIGTPYGAASETPLDAYAASMALNAVAGPLLGKAFLDSCLARKIPATVVLCSSPATLAPMPGMSHYGSGKAAAEYWVKSVALEERENSLVRVFAVMPFAVRTPMVESVLAQRVHPVPQSLRDAADEGRLASPDDTAREIWDLIIGDVESGAVIPVGAVPAGMRT